MCWDNFDLNEETPLGAGTTHTAHRIIIQELERGANLPAGDLSHVPRSQEHTIHPIIEDLQPCFAKAKAEPNFNVTRSRPQLCDVGYANLSDFLWMISRNKSSKTEQSVPSWAGWLSATSETSHQLDNEPRCSTVDYMASFLFPITENATVQHVLEVSQKATENLAKSSQLRLLTFVSQGKPLILCGKTKEGLVRS